MQLWCERSYANHTMKQEEANGTKKKPMTIEKSQQLCEHNCELNEQILCTHWAYMWSVSRICNWTTWQAEFISANRKSRAIKQVPVFDSRLVQLSYKPQGKKYRFITDY